MAKIILDKQDFINMTPQQLDAWICYNRTRLIGSAIFTTNDSFISKVVSWAESWKNKKAEFKPSHVGSIIGECGILYVFNMAPPHATITTLESYLLYTKDNYKLVMRDFKLNAKMFSANIMYHLGEFYPYLSALRSVLTKRRTKYVRHCSEMHLTELQKQGLFKNVNPEITPLELYELFKSYDLADLESKEDE